MIDTILVWSDKEISVTDLTKIAASKLKHQLQTDSFINIEDFHYFQKKRVYVVLYQVPDRVLNSSPVLVMRSQT